MIPHLRKQFNTNFSQEKYRRFLQRLDDISGVHIGFPVCETPCFFPKSLIEQIARYGKELIEQLVNSQSYHSLSDRSIPLEFNVLNEAPHPIFVQVDFGLVRSPSGESKDVQPKLVEIQGFPSLYAYQVLLAQQYQQVYGLDENLQFFLSGLDLDSYNALLRRAIVGDHDPKNVILMEIDPFEQKTLVDFILTERICGIKIVHISDIVKEDNRLLYVDDGKRIPIKRIYNRAIVDELVRKGTKFSFRFRDDLDVEWAGHPNWFYRISKFSIPFLKHISVPKTQFFHEVERLPEDLENYVLKPLFSFAGLGVLVGPTKADLEKIPQEKRSQYILQERLDFEPVIETPRGATKAEVRVMYIWLERLLPVLTIVRMGRGKMMGVDFNKNMEWVGSSAALFPE